MENQSNDYVQIRFESSKVLDAKDQADHDTRTKNPSYIRDEHAHNKESNTIYVWDENNAIQTFNLMTRKKEKDRTVRNEVNRILHKQLDDEVKKVKDECKNFRPNKHAIVVNGIITLSNSLIEKYEQNEIDKENIDKYFIDALQKVSKELNLKIMNASIHYDEKVPHLHFNVRNYYDGKGISLELKKSYSKAQDIVGSVFENIGYRRGEKKKTNGRVKDHLEVLKMQQKEIEMLSKKVENERQIKDSLDKENQAIARKHEIMKNDLDDYENRKRYYQTELQNLKSEYESFKNSDKIKQIDAYKTLKFTVQKLENEFNTKTEKVKKMDEIIGQKKGEYDNVKDLVAFLPKAYDEVEEEGFFLKKHIHAPAGYTFIKSDDYQKVRNAMISIKKYESENNCSINDVIKDNTKLRREREELEKKYKTELYYSELNAKKMIENITKQAKETYDEKVYELQCIINEQADNLKHFRNKVSEMLHTLQVKFGITEKDLNTESVKFSKSSNNTKKIER